MDASIGVNLRVTAHSNQGGRKYMEDMFCVAYQPTADEKDLLYAYFGIFDGHGGREAALYAKTHLMDHIVSQKNFWSEEDELVLRSIKDGFISVHQAMWRELEKWPKTQSGLPSTSGTTASVAFVRRGKLYIGHVGDSGIVLGYQDPNSTFWKAKPLTLDHKPENPIEHARIIDCGGKVVSKSGVPRVVWNRPRLGHRGPVRRSTLIDEIPFLAVARSLGDLWSYNSEQNEFVVSPVPDTAVIEIDVNIHRCLILGSDGLWNMLSAQDAVNSVYFAEKNNERQNQIAALMALEGSPAQKNWINPSKRLVDRALDRWYSHNLRADNTSVVTVVIDPPGPPKVQKAPSPRTSSSSSSSCSSLSSGRSSPASSLSCAQTNHGKKSPTIRYHRDTPNAIFTINEKMSPPRVTSPLHNSNPQPLPPQPESPSLRTGSPGGDPDPDPDPPKPKTKVTSPALPTIFHRLRHHHQQQQSTRDLPVRGRRNQAVVSSKTSRVMHVKGVSTNSTAAAPTNQPIAASPPMSPLLALTRLNLDLNRNNEKSSSKKPAGDDGESTGDDDDESVDDDGESADDGGESTNVDESAKDDGKPTKDGGKPAKDDGKSAGDDGEPTNDEETNEDETNDDQVQINEISSSCEESWRSDSSDLDDSIQASSPQVADAAKKSAHKRVSKRGTTRGASSSLAVPTNSSRQGAGKGRKRASRQSAGEDSTVSPSKVIKLSSTGDGKSSGTTQNKRSATGQRFGEDPLQEAVAKLRNRTRDIMTAERSSSLVTVQVPSGRLLRFGTSRQRLSTVQNISQQQQLPTNLPEVPPTSGGVQQEGAPVGQKSTSESSTSSKGKAKKGSTREMKPLNQNNAPVASTSERSHHSSRASITIAPRLLSLRLHPSRIHGTGRPITIAKSTMKKSKPALKRLQPGKKPTTGAAKSSKKEASSAPKKESSSAPKQESSSAPKKESSNPKKETSTPKKESSPPKKDSSSPKKDSSNKKEESSEGRSLRSGDIPPGRLTRSRNTSRK